MSGQKPREIAVRVLTGDADGEFVEDRFERILTGKTLAPADRRLCQELVYGVVRWRATLDYLVARKTSGRCQKTGLQNLLRLGLYQIFWLDRIPNHAAVHETVELSKELGFGPQAGFVNAVLRGYLREDKETRQLMEELKQKDPALGYSHPEWLAHRWSAAWGVDGATKLMQWNNLPPKTFARANTLKGDPGKLLTQWRDEDVEYDFVRHDWCEENMIFELKSHPPLSRLPSFQQGLFYVQDPSTLLAVHELAPEPGETILDLCAAPGGKLTYISQRMRNEGSVIAQDQSAERLKLVAENCKRLGVTNCECLVTPKASPFDRVLVDAPCSNTGVMRRRVDLRWRLRLEEIERLSRSQLELLKRAAEHVRPAGMLVYSTCSLEREENQEVVKEFLVSQPRFQLDRERELRPFHEGVDGAYVACMRRTA